jgi:carboxyl-terminal processing protease
VSADRRSGFRFGLVVGLIAGLLIVGAAGYYTDVFGADAADDPVVTARQVIEDNYYKVPDPAHLNDASIAGMVDDLRKRFDDKFSHYFTAEDLKIFEEQTSGRIFGIGLTVSEVPKGLRIASVLPDSPAKEAGLQEGDVITEVDGKSIAGVSSEVSTARIKGPPGTEVTLRVIPADGDKPYDLTIERAQVRVPAVDGVIRREDGEKIAYVRFATFSEGAHSELRDTIERLERRGAGGLVLDLRGNGGGLLNEAVLCASIFLEDGNVVSTRSRTQGDQDFPAVGDAIAPRPMVVLVNRDTASASEILTAALKQNDLATVVGTRTYGKGVFQEVMDLPAGGALDLTIGQYLTSDGTSILGVGVKPNVRVEDDPKTTDDDEALDRALQVVGDEIAADQP